MILLSECVLCNVIAIIAITLSSIYLYFKYAYTHWKKLGVPYMEPQFPYGNSTDVIKAKMPMGQYLVNVYNEMKAKGHKFVGIYFFHKPTFVPICPELVKSIMLRDFSHFHDRGVYHNEEDDPLSAHLFSLNGQKWRNLRAKLTPTFTSGKLKKMFSTLVNSSLELKDCLNEPISKSEPIDIKSILVQYTTDVIGSCAFGIECNSFKNPNTEFIKLGHKIFCPDGMDRAKLFLAFTLPSVANFLKIRLTNKDVDKFYRQIVKDTVEYREKNNITRNDFMQLLIELKNKGIIEDDEHHDQEHDKSHINEIGTTLTLNEASAQAFLFFIAGFETSSTAATFCLFELSQYPDIQGKLREEIVRVLKKHDGKITYDALMEMHYMDRVIQEAMRKYPPLMILQRIVTKDYKIPDTNITLKKDTNVLIPVLALQRDPEFYPDPEKFDPERFTEENKATRPDYTWLPFGEGPRVCIGLRFGMMQIKVGLCQLLINYKFTLNSKTELPLIMDPFSFVASAKDKIWLTAERI